MEFESNVKFWYAHISTWLITIGAALTYFSADLHALLTQALDMWNLAPEEVKGSVSDSVVKYIGIAISVLAIPAKYTIQKNLPQE